MYKLIRSFLFIFNSEFIHNFSSLFIKFLIINPFTRNLCRKIYTIDHDKLKRNFLGLNFNTPIGLAAGFDKDAKLFNYLEPFGFGFVEIGTVTPIAQAGSPKPRLFRLKDDSALINRMGFNNSGVDAVVKRLKQKRTNIIIGGNIGKNKDTLNDQAVDDYVICFEKLFHYVDYFTVNVSSPNTAGLRDLQNRAPLEMLLNKLQSLNNHKIARKPILLKISPDLTNEQLDDIIEIVHETDIDGVIATNTTVSRTDLRTKDIELEKIGDGGLSGKPLKNRSTEIVRYLSTKSKKSFLIIGVGGIHSADDALEKLDAGADLIQIYTGFVYEGPTLLKRINQKILEHENN